MTAGIHMHVLYMYLIKKQYKQSGFDAQDCSPRTHKTLPMGDKLLITKTINVGVYRCSSVINK